MQTVVKYKSLLFLLVTVILLCSCQAAVKVKTEIDYRQEMRQFVEKISAYARTIDPNFIIIPQNGQELLAQGEDSRSGIDQQYIDSIDGIGREDLFYGYEGDDTTTDPVVIDLWLDYLNLAKEKGLAVLVIDYCSTPEKIDASYSRSAELGFLSFAADRRELDAIPVYPAVPFAENDAAIKTLQQAHNFLYLINPAQYSSKEEFIDAIIATNYDLLVMDLYFNDEAFTTEEVEQLRQKANGGSRLVLCYLSIGEAEDYRPYWQPAWNENPPEWLLEENPNWAGNYRVRYWDEDWQALITGSADSYLGKILNAGFDGVYLDLVDAFWEFESTS